MRTNFKETDFSKTSHIILHDEDCINEYTLKTNFVNSVTKYASDINQYRIITSNVSPNPGTLTSHITDYHLHWNILDVCVGIIVLDLKNDGIKLRLENLVSKELK